jgi:hypothetical protein
VDAALRRPGHGGDRGLWWPALRRFGARSAIGTARRAR